MGVDICVGRNIKKETDARESLRLAADKLQVRTKLRGSKPCCRSEQNKPPRRNRVMAEQDQPSPSPASPQAKPRGSRKTRTGEVISGSMNKTIVVRTVTR